MADNRPTAPDLFDATKNYTGVRWPDGDLALLASELNLAQQIQDYMRKLTLDRVFREGVIGELGGTIGTPVQGVHVGGQVMSASGAFIGLDTITYTVRCITGGAVGTATFDFTTAGDDVSPGPQIITAYDTWHVLGSRGVLLKWTGSGDFAAGDSWIFTCTYNLQLPVVTVGAGATDTVTLIPTYVYLDGKMLLVAGAALAYAKATTGKGYVYLEALTKRITWDDDATLIIPRTVEPASWRETIVVSFQDHDTTGEALPTRCTKRLVRPAYQWDRATNLVTRYNASSVKLDLNDLSGVLLADRVQKFDVQEEVKGILAERTDDESGSYLVGDRDLDTYIQSERNTFTVDAAVAAGANAGDDTPVSGGVHTGLTGAILEVKITMGGAPGVAKITVYDDVGGAILSGPTTVSAFGTAVAIGTAGATLTFPLVAGDDGVLTLNDTWTVRCVDPATSAGKTIAGKAYVNGLRYLKEATELLAIPVANTTAETTELIPYVFGTNAYRPAKTTGDWDFPIDEITAFSAEVLVRENITSHTPGGMDQLSHTAARILAVTDTDSATLTGSETTFDFSGTGADARANCFEIAVSPYAGGSVGTEQAIYFTPGIWTIAEILEALNCGTGPAYQSGSANENLYYSDDGSGHLIIQSMGGSTEQTILIGDGTANIILGFSNGATDTGSGTQYDTGTDWNLSGGDYLDWAGAAQEPTSTYWVTYTYSKSLTDGTEYLMGGELTGTKAWAVCAVRGANTVSWPASTAAVTCSPDGDIVKLTWGAVPDANEYMIYRGNSATVANMKLIAIVGGAAVSFVDTGYLEDGAAISLTGNRFMTPVSTEVYVRGAVNLNVPYAVTEPTVGEFETNRPLNGVASQLDVDYAYYQPRYVLRVIRHTGELEDVYGTAADTPREPNPVSHSLPLARIYCPAGGHATTADVFNFDYRATSMIELRRLVQQVEDIRYDLGRLDQISQIHDQEAAALRGVWAEAFSTEFQGDTTHPEYDCAMNPVEHCMQPAFDVTTVPLTMPVSPLAVGVKAGRSVVTLDYTEIEEVVQDNWSREWNVNPYAVFYPEVKPTPWAILSPSRDYWVDTSTISYDELFLEFWYQQTATGTPRQVTKAEVDAALAKGVVPIGTLETQRTEFKLLHDGAALVARQIPIVVYGQNFAAGASVEIRFSDAVVTPVPVTGWTMDPLAATRIIADAGGAFQCTITVPPNQATGQHQVRCIGHYAVTGGGHTAGDLITGNDVQAAFTSEGRVQVFEERKIKATYYIDPIAETFRFATDGFLTKIDIPMAKKDATLPLQFMLRDVENGIPTELADMIEVRASGDVNAGDTSHNYWIPPDPVFMDSRYSRALTLLTDSPQGYAAYVAEGGKEDHLGVFIATQPYADGVFMDSSNFQTWTPHQNADLRFTAHRAVFSTVVPGVMTFDEQTWTTHEEMTGFLLVVGQEIPSGTAVAWEYRVRPTSASAQLAWRPLTPNVYMELVNETAYSIQVRATLTTTNARLSPVISSASWALVLVQNYGDDTVTDLEDTYVGDTTDLVLDVDAVTVYIEELNPSGTGTSASTTPAQVTCDEAENYVIGNTGTNTITLDVDGAGATPVTITPGTRTATQVKADIDTAAITGLTCTVTGGRVKLSAVTSVEITAIGANCATLGFHLGKHCAITSGHEVMLSANGGESWMTPNAVPVNGADAGNGYVKRTYAFGATGANYDGVKVRVRGYSQYRYLLPKARSMSITMV